MKVTGFSFIRNAIKFDYPIVESIKSILPVCDDFVVAVGNSEDGTLDLIRSIAPDKIRIVETVWDDSLRTGGQVLAEETNKAFRAIGEDTDWCFYIQGDEVVHEKYHPAIIEGMNKWKDHKEVDGLLFKYLHFYGSYDYVGTSSTWYPNEIRIIRNNKDIYSYRDAQGFRKGNNEKLRVKAIDAYMYHYGWVKDPRAMQRKQEQFNKLWHEDEWVEKNVVKANEFDYARNIDALELFKSTHPKVMQERINKINWKFDYDISFNNLSTKEKLKSFAGKYLGLNFSYKNYKLI
ncbi:glycosyltransferase family 2 protein [Polluticoccus soli]|uniref:glycosyltransferase family 2 protein n=1 Tax=Polluticoccus soli TaxID=3034150 RepID=UPI0023E1B168|nr:glycosyltransferase family 2 protein [Flavipsychrobacter sp. JY13-12]